MFLRSATLVLFVFIAIGAPGQEVSVPPKVPAAASVSEDFNQTVISIADFKIDVRPNERIRYPSMNPMSYVYVGAIRSAGTGFCLDPGCRFICTNYHVALQGTPRRIKGEKVVGRYLATGPDDDGAMVNEGGGAAKYTLKRDLAIFALHRSLPNHHGIGFDLEELNSGQAVIIYAFPREGLKTRHLVKVRGTFMGLTTQGLLLFDYNSSDGKILPGASGGIVVDTKTQKIVGIVSGTDTSRKASALAVPVESLVEFVSKVQPFLAERIFPRVKVISPVSADLYPKAPPPAVAPSHHRADEPYDVWLLRVKAQALADSMHNFSAVQTFEWGAGSADRDPAATAAYEVQVLDGHQQFREYPEGKRYWSDNPPFPILNTVFVPGSDWSDLPRMVGRELRLRIQRAADVVVNERRMKVFQYEASAEDRICGWRSITDYGFFSTKKDRYFDCHGEVWTDENTNILRISERLEQREPLGGWDSYAGIVTYGWLTRPGETTRLIPLTISTQAEHQKKTYWCRGQFTHYREFGARVKITPVDAVSEAR